MFRRRATLSTLLLLLLGPSRSATAAPEVVDRGTFLVFSRDQAVGAETFTVEGTRESLWVTSKAWQKPPGGDQELQKELMMTARRDFGLLEYRSDLRAGGRKYMRAVVMSDTSMTVYRQIDEFGEGDHLAVPPGRLFVVDPHLFVLFNFICLSLRDKTFESWPLSMLTLGARDTMLAATATHLGVEAIRWGAKPVQARKLKISDGTTDFWVWVNPAGQMLRLEHRDSGMRVEREAPAVKRRASGKS
jgi:hypothetical protein